MIHIGKSDLRVTRPAHRAYVHVKRIPGTPPDSDYVLLYCDDFQFTGTVDLVGRAAPDDPAKWGPGDVPGRWRIGFAQLDIKITDRAYYRGDSNKDGSVTVLRDRPPALVLGASRDSQSRGDPYCYAPYVTGTGLAHPVWGSRATPFPLNLDVIINEPVTVQVCHTDSPAQSHPVFQTNSITGQPCMLHSVLVEYQFVTVLMVMDRARVFHQVKHIFWNVHWDSAFDRIATQAGASIVPRVNTRNTRMAYGPVLDGAPTSAHVRHLLTVRSTPTSTMRVRNAVGRQSIVPSRTW